MLGGLSFVGRFVLCWEVCPLLEVYTLLGGLSFWNVPFYQRFHEPRCNYSSPESRTLILGPKPVYRCIYIRAPGPESGFESGSQSTWERWSVSGFESSLPPFKCNQSRSCRIWIRIPVLTGLTFERPLAWALLYVFNCVFAVYVAEVFTKQCHFR